MFFYNLISLYPLSYPFEKGKIEIMLFKEKDFLLCRGAVNQNEPERIENLLIGERAIGKWDDRSRSPGYGWDYVKMYPAYYKGEKTFVEERIWCPAEGYSASGTEERVISFEEGVKILLKKGAYEHIWKTNET
jgi:hypothetical protein